MSIEVNVNHGGKEYRLTRRETVHMTQDGVEKRDRTQGLSIVEMHGHDTSLIDQYKQNPGINTSAYWNKYAAENGLPVSSETEAKSPELDNLKAQVNTLEERLSALESQLQSVSDERDSLLDRNSQLEQAVSLKDDQISALQQQLVQARVRPAEPVVEPVAETAPVPPPEPASAAEEPAATVAPADEPAAVQTEAVHEVVTDTEPANDPRRNLSWRDRTGNFFRGRSLHSQTLWYRENGAWRREESVETRDSRWRAAALVLGGIAVALLIKRYGFDWDHHHGEAINNFNSDQIDNIDSKITGIEAEINDIQDKLDNNSGVSPDAGAGDSGTQEGSGAGGDGNDMDIDEPDSTSGGEGEDKHTGEGKDEHPDEGNGAAQDNGNGMDKADGNQPADGGSGLGGGHIEIFNEQHGNRTVQSILPSNLEQDRVGLYERIIDKDTGNVIVDHVTYKENGPYSLDTVQKLRSQGYSVSYMSIEGSNRFMSVVR